MKFNIGDRVKIKPLDIDGSVFLIDESDNAIFPYLIEDDCGQFSWCRSEDVEELK